MLGAKVKLLRLAFPTRNWFWTTWKLNKKLNSDTLLDVETLNSLITNKYKNLKLLDASWYMPTDERKGPTEYKKETIPG
jgi:hypothetical protein